MTKETHGGKSVARKVAYGEWFPNASGSGFPIGKL